MYYPGQQVNYPVAQPVHVQGVYTVGHPVAYPGMGVPSTGITVGVNNINDSSHLMTQYQQLQMRHLGLRCFRTTNFVLMIFSIFSFGAALYLLINNITMGGSFSSIMICLLWEITAILDFFIFKAGVTAYDEHDSDRFDLLKMLYMVFLGLSVISLNVIACIVYMYLFSVVPQVKQCCESLQKVKQELRAKGISVH